MVRTLYSILSFFIIQTSLVFPSTSYFFSNNNIAPPLFADRGFQLTDLEIKKIISSFNTIYVPIFKKRGYTLLISNDWGVDELNASAHKIGTIRQVSVSGGLARYPGVTSHVFAFMLCHEIGHHLGGAPLKKNRDSVEGQADYFAATKCMRRWLQEQDLDQMKTSLKSPYVLQKCRQVYSNNSEVKKCLLIAEAGKIVAEMSATIQSARKPIFNNPDKRVVEKSLINHPSPQCRLDTIFQGALCDNDLETPFSMSDPSVGACSSAKGDSVGVRPRCWFKGN